MPTAKGLEGSGKYLFISILCVIGVLLSFIRGVMYGSWLGVYIFTALAVWFFIWSITKSQQ